MSMTILVLYFLLSYIKNIPYVPYFRLNFGDAPTDVGVLCYTGDRLMTSFLYWKVHSNNLHPSDGTFVPDILKFMVAKM